MNTATIEFIPTLIWILGESFFILLNPSPLPDKWLFWALPVPRSVNQTINMGTYVVLYLVFMYHRIMAAMERDATITSKTKAGVFTLLTSTYFWVLMVHFIYFFTCSYYPWAVAMAVLVYDRHCRNKNTASRSVSLSEQVAPSGLTSESTQDSSVYVTRVASENQTVSFTSESTWTPLPTVENRASTTFMPTVENRTSPTFMPTVEDRASTTFMPTVENRASTTFMPTVENRASTTFMPTVESRATWMSAVPQQQDVAKTTTTSPSPVLKPRGLFAKSSEQVMESPAPGMMSPEPVKKHPEPVMKSSELAMEPPELIKKPSAQVKKSLAPVKEPLGPVKKTPPKDRSKTLPGNRKGYCGGCSRVRSTGYSTNLPLIRSPRQTRSGLVYGPPVRTMSLHNYVREYGIPDSRRKR